ncbi:MAG TPA: UDP-N-acetylglucosamine 1-carboxyvinyltransferase [Actinomycetota bacterium]|nr:UDP-N-acetylglucosamine 1-carboxyvinyltransferase [Actinomycetota bacterium]
MEHFRVEGGHRLSGSVKVSGAKNSALKLMAASLLTRGRTVLINVPRIADVFTMGEVLEYLGADVEFESDCLSIDTSVREIRTHAPYELVRRMRASINVLGPLIARYGHGRVAMPGGCNIGSRPIQIHQQALQRLGVEFHVDHGDLEGHASELTGTKVVLDFPTRGATENLLTAGALARGTTVIENAAREPDIIDLAEFLNKMGAKVSGAGTPTITIEGVSELRPAAYKVPSDPIEAGSLALMVLASYGEAELVGARARDLELFLTKLSDTGARWKSTENGIEVTATHRPVAVDFATLPFPGFPTDLQPQMVAYLAAAEGTSIVTENIFESRFMHVNELTRMGADIRIEGQHAVIRGVPRLAGAPVRASDLRAGAALVIAALGAEGITTIHDVHHIDRGYENLEQKLLRLGAQLERVTEELSFDTSFLS